MAYDIDTFGELPGELALIAEETSADVAFILADSFGGRHIDFPKALTKENKVVKAVGVEAAKIIWEYWSGGRVRIPLAKKFRIRYMWKRGDRVDEISARVGVSDATVYPAIRGLSRDHQPERNRSRLSIEADERARFVQLRLNDGANARAIADELNITRATVRELAKRRVSEIELGMESR